MRTVMVNALSPAGVGWSAAVPCAQICIRGWAFQELYMYPWTPCSGKLEFVHLDATEAGTSMQVDPSINVLTFVVKR